MKVKKVGDLTVRESHESGAITVEEFQTKTIVKRGMYADLVELLQAKGAEHSDGWWVVSSRLEPGPGGTGTLTVTVADKRDGEEEDGSFGTPLVEIEWQRLEKPLQVNPILMKGYTGETLQVAVNELEAWRNSPQQRRRKYQIPKADLKREPNPDKDEDWVALTGGAMNLAKKVEKGIEGYLVFSPVVSRTSLWSQRPQVGKCGLIQSAPSAPAGYVYLRVADSAVEQADGTWRRTEQWQGADAWDTDLYAQG